MLTAGLLWLTSLWPMAVVAYEPDFEELVRNREQIERFCSLLDHRHRFAICETFEKQRSKLPKTTGELELLRRTKNGTND
jgi:hypothetical protein